MLTLPRTIFSAQQIRQIEELCAKQGIADETTLMERAGTAAWQILQERWPEAMRLTVFCGPGNNGGDGYVLAKHAALAGKDVTVLQIGGTEHFSTAAKSALTSAKNSGVSIHPTHAQVSLEKQNQHHVIVDAIFGTGLNNIIDAKIADIIKQINNSAMPIFAIDIPSGIQADTGNVLGIAVNATATVTFIGLKLGLFTAQGRAYCGDIFFQDLHIPNEILSTFPLLATRLSKDLLSIFSTKRRRDAYKNNFGHVLIIGGDHGMPGAVSMAGEAALRTGAGLVSIATQPDHVEGIISRRPEIMVHGIKKPEQLEPLLERATTIVIGPGLGRSSWSSALFVHAIQSNLPTVVDADGLFWLSQYELTKDNWVLTPHTGEAAELLQTEPQQIQANRLAAVGLLQVQYGGVVALKGPGTLIFGNSHLPAVCTDGNPGMASGGMGDVLSGIIGGLIAQHLPLELATQIGVLIHALAGDKARDNAGERGLLATDLLPYIRTLINP